MAGGDIEFVHEYDTLYPPGPGRAIAERVCMSCHGLNFFPLKQWTAPPGAPPST